MLGDTGYSYLGCPVSASKALFGFRKSIESTARQNQSQSCSRQVSGEMTINKLQNTNKFQKRSPNEQAVPGLIGIAR